MLIITYLYSYKTNRLEGFGPLTAPAEKAPTNLRASILAESKYRKSMEDSPKFYPSMQAGVDARVSVVSKYPGTQSLSKEAAASIIG